MKFNLKMMITMVLFAVVLCSMITTARAAPTIAQNDVSSVELPAEADDTAAPKVRSKRAIIFRPLFVYRQQQIKKQLVQQETLKLSKSNPDKVDFNYYAGQFPSRRQ